MPHARQHRRPSSGLTSGPPTLRAALWDKGYISAPLAEQLFLDQGLRLITKLRTNMRNQLLEFSDRLLLRKRALIETIFDQLKNICQIEHSRHRSPINFCVHLLAGLIAYCRQPRSPR